MLIIKIINTLKRRNPQTERVDTRRRRRVHKPAEIRTQRVEL